MSFREQVDQINEHQGWNESTQLRLALRFIENNKLGNEFVGYLEQLMRDEEVWAAAADGFMYTPKECLEEGVHGSDLDDNGDCFLCGQEPDP